MSAVKRCVQCGLLKDEEAFRKYTYSRTNETKGRYRLCKACEAINSAYRRAKAYVANNAHSTEEGNSDLIIHYKEIISKTEKLYETLELKGLRVPSLISDEKPEPDAVDTLLAFYSDPINSKAIPPTKVVPAELQEWLDIPVQVWKDADLSPEYLQETVYESLKAKYRPQIGVDHNTYLPIYDDTYRDVLNNILRRFDDYEEELSLDREE